MSSDDLAFNKTASQSHQTIGQKERANDAVDGNAETCAKTDDIGRNSLRSKVWWKVDLGKMYSIYSINILFKNYDGYGMYFRYFNFSYIDKKKNNLKNGIIIEDIIIA